MAKRGATTRFVFCFGQYAPLGPASVSAEWRDYLLGLDELGVEVAVVDLLAADHLAHARGPFSLGLAFWSKAPQLLDPLNLDPYRPLEISRGLDEWLGLGSEAGARADLYPAALARVLSHQDALRARSALIRSRRAVDYLARIREASADDSISAKDRPRLQRILTGRAGSGAGPTMAVVDFFDLIHVGGATLRRLSEEAIRRLGFQGPLRFVVRAMTEYTGPSRRMLEPLKHFDEVWVPAEFHLPVFAAGSSHGLAVRKVPEALDAELFQPPRRRRRLPGARSCAFLILSNYALGAQPEGWNEVRKATDLMIRAFLVEFSAEEDATLVLKGHSRVETMEARLMALLALEGQPARRRAQFLLLGRVRQERLPSLYAAVDALLGVSRGEGWGRPLAEAMASGTVAVGTRFGGSTEFMKDEHSFLVDCEQVPLGPFARAYNLPEARWAEPSQAHLQRILREIFTNRRAARRKGRAASAFVRERYSRAAVARSMLREATRPELAS